jgi:tetratricopeptide (TPR) repeat protein
MPEQVNSLEYTAEYIRTFFVMDASEEEGITHWLAEMYARMESGDIAGCQYLIRVIKGIELSPHCLGLFNLGTGDFSAQLEDWPAAEKAYQQSVKHFEASNEPTDRAIALNNMALVLQEQGRYEEANACYQQVAEIYAAAGSQVSLGHTLSNLGSVADQQGDWGSAISYYQQSISVLQKTEEKHDLASVYSNLGVSFENLGKWTEAETSYLRCADIVDEMDESFSELGIRVLMNLGQLYVKQGDGEKAIRVYQQALEISQELDDDQVESSIWNNLGTVHTRLKQHQDAAECFQKSLELAQRRGDRQAEALGLCNIGSSFQDLGQSELAMNCFKNSLAISEELEDQYGMARANNNLAVLYEDLHQYDQALMCYENSAETLSAIGDDYRAITTLVNIGTLLAKRGRLLEAQRIVEQAWQLAKGNHYFDQLMTVSILQGDIAFQQTSTEPEAYHFYANACEYAGQHSKQALEHVLDIIELQLKSMQQHQQMRQAKAFCQTLLHTWESDEKLLELRSDAVQEFKRWISASLHDM